MTIIIKEGEATLTMSESTVNTFGDNLTLFNPSSIEFLYRELDAKTPNKIENLPKIPNHDTVDFTHGETNVTHYAVTSEFLFKSFAKKLQSTLDLITLNEMLKNFKINCTSIKVN